MAAVLRGTSPALITLVVAAFIICVLVSAALQLSHR